MNNPRIVFCTTCKGRTQHLAQTLPQNLADNQHFYNCKFVVLTYGDSEALLYLKNVHSANIASGYLAVYSYRTTEPFHMSHAKNMAMRCGILEGADILVTLDADNYTGPNFAQYIADHSERGYYLCPNFELIQSLPFGPDRPGRGYYGRLAIRTQDFIKLGGYDEEFDTWRGEDTDILARLKRTGHQMKFFRNSNLNVIRHDAAIRFKEYPHAQEWEEASKTNETLQSVEARNRNVVNAGKFGAGTVYRNFEALPIELLPVPTRIFGIGMHKTATTSLGDAFDILGFDSWHFNSGNDARLIWEEMNSVAHVHLNSLTLEQWYALCDLPIPMLYQKLDRAYPGSKFILTIRNEQKWLESVKRMWDPRHNVHRWTWDVYPISHKLHTALYGRKEFDARIFLERYRRHNAEVREYFKNRPDDLLVMDMDAGNLWNSLCTFLRVPVPTVPYPMKNFTAAHRASFGSCPVRPEDVEEPVVKKPPTAWFIEEPWFLQKDAKPVEEVTVDDSDDISWWRRFKTLFQKKDVK